MITCWRFWNELSDPRGMNMSLRHVSVSTCGIVDKIYDLAERRLQLTAFRVIARSRTTLPATR